MSTWSDLRELRRQGLKPRLPVYVTTHFDNCRSHAEEGAMVIVHKAGEKFEFDLLSGLDVCLRLDSCEQVSRVSRRLKELEIRPASALGWCRCEGDWNSFCWPNCKAGQEAHDVWEAMCQPKT